MAISADDRLTLFEHLDELRRRITVCLVALVAGVVLAAVFNNFVFSVLLHPLRQIPGLPATAYTMTTFSPAEPFMTSLKVWVVAGLLLASPVLFWELWAFVGPAFTGTEKRWFYPVVAATTLLFLGGVSLAYFIVLPKGLQWLLTFGSGNFNVQLRASDYLTFTALFLLAFGAVFEMPVILVLLAKVGVLDDKMMRKYRRYAILANAVIAAVITPSQDAFSMLAMFIPLVVLYEISVWLARLVQPKRESAADGADAGVDDDTSAAPA